MSVVVKLCESAQQFSAVQLMRRSPGLMEYLVLVSVIGFVLPNFSFYL